MILQEWITFQKVIQLKCQHIKVNDKVKLIQMFNSAFCKVSTEIISVYSFLACSNLKIQNNLIKNDICNEVWRYVMPYDNFVKTSRINEI